MLDTDPGLLDALRQIARQLVADLLVKAPVEAVLGPVSEHPHRVVGEGGAVLDVARVVGLDEVERLAPGAPQSARAAPLHRPPRRAPRRRRDTCSQSPVTGGVEGHPVAGVRERTRPLALDHLRAEGVGDLDVAVEFEPVSTMMISSTAGAAAARQRGSISSSSRTIMHRLSLRPSAGLARLATRQARSSPALGQHAVGCGRRLRARDGAAAIPELGEVAA